MVVDGAAARATVRIAGGMPGVSSTRMIAAAEQVETVPAGRWWSRRGGRRQGRHCNAIEAAYARADLFERRRLMDDLAEYIEGQP